MRLSARLLSLAGLGAALIAGVLFSTALSSTAQAQSDTEKFFAGKNLDFIVGSAPAAATLFMQWLSRSTWENICQAILTSSAVIWRGREA